MLWGWLKLWCDSLVEIMNTVPTAVKSIHMGLTTMTSYDNDYNVQPEVMQEARARSARPYHVVYGPRVRSNPFIEDYLAGDVLFHYNKLLWMFPPPTPPLP